MTLFYLAGLTVRWINNSIRTALSSEHDGIVIECVVFEGTMSDVLETSTDSTLKLVGLAYRFSELIVQTTAARYAVQVL